MIGIRQVEVAGSMERVGQLVEYGANIAKYYAMFRREPSPLGDAVIEKTVPLPDVTFEKLVDTMLQLGKKEYLVALHGTPLGFPFPLTNDEGSGDALAVDATAKGGGGGPLDVLNQIVDGAEKGDAADAAATDALRVDAWKRLLRQLPKGPKAGEIDKVEDKKQARELLESWMDSFGNTAGHSGKPLRRLVGKVRKLRARKLERVEFRACNIGARKDTLEIIRKALGAARITGPTVPSFYLPVMPSFGPNVFQQGLTKGPEAASDRRRYRGFAPSPPSGNGQQRAQAPLRNALPPEEYDFYLDVMKIDSVAYKSTNASAKNRGALAPWVAKFVMAGSTYNPTVSRNFHLAGFWTKDRKNAAYPFVTPGEDAYVKLIATAP